MMIACAKHKGFIKDCGCPDPSKTHWGAFSDIQRQWIEQESGKTEAFAQKMRHFLYGTPPRNEDK